MSALANLALPFEEVVDVVTYDPFGPITAETAPALGGRFKYTGRDYDAATGLYDYRHRGYDPKTGRFVEQDPIGFAAGDVNLYRYVGNAPTIYVDPFGLYVKDFDNADRQMMIEAGVTPPKKLRVPPPPSIDPHGWEKNQRALDGQLGRDLSYMVKADPLGAMDSFDRGLRQGQYNVANAVTDVPLDTANTAIATFVPPIPGLRPHLQWEWSRDLVRDENGIPIETPETHDLSRAAAGIGVNAGLLAAGMGGAKAGTRRPGPKLRGRELMPDDIPARPRGPASQSNTFVDLTDAKARKHILEGDATGGGHRPGLGKPGKSEFPKGWRDEKILHEISDVATDPASKVTPGRSGRLVIEGMRDGVDIRVIVEPPSKGGRIVTGFPTNAPRNL